MRKKIARISTLICIIAFVFGCIQLPQICSAQQAQVDQEKARSVMTNVIGLDLTKYNVQLTNYLSDTPSVYAGMFHEVMIFNLTSNQNSIMVMCQFLNGKFISYNIYQLNGSLPIYSQSNPSAMLDITKNALQKYYTYSSLQTAQNAQVLLSTVVGTRPVNTTDGNLTLNVVTNNYGSTQIDWLKSVDGADYPTGLSMHFNNNTIIEFSDLSSFYSIGNSLIAISRDEAISIAQKEAFSNNQLNVTAADGSSQKVTLELPSQPQFVQLSTACKQPLVYSPIWQIEFYSSTPIESTVGYQVGIWADSGKIQYSHLTSEFGVTNDTGSTTNNPPTSTPASNIQSVSSLNQGTTLLIVGIVIGVVLSSVLLFIKQRRNK